jgi:hypothetical protein
MSGVDVKVAVRLVRFTGLTGPSARVAGDFSSEIRPLRDRFVSIATSHAALADSEPC